MKPFVQIPSNYDTFAPRVGKIAIKFTDSVSLRIISTLC